jgi:hypothetical protein
MAMVNNPDRIFMSKAKAFNEALSKLPGSIGPSSSSSLRNAAAAFYFIFDATGAQVGAGLKELITEAFKNANADLRNSGMRLNKGELYAILFTHGLPMGVIAKILLNGNLGPIRNAIILHRQGVAGIFEVKTFDGANIEFLDEYSGALTFGSRYARTLMRISENSQEPQFVRVCQKFALVCHAFGGESLLNKLLSSSDQIAFCNSYRNEDGSIAFGYISTFVEPLNFAAYGSRLGTRTVRNKMIRYAENLLSVVPGRRRGVRETGLTTSRAAQRVNAGQELPSVQSARETGSTVSTQAVTPRAEVTESRAQTPVRDIQFENTTFGVEFELVPDKDNNSRSLTSNLIKEFEKEGLSVRARSYTHEVTEYWKIVPDGSVSPEGAEVVAPVLKGKDGIEKIRKALRAMRAAGGHINNSVGVHVHFGAQGLELEQFKNLIYNYTGFEPLIDLTLNKLRRGSIWAQSVKDVERTVGSETLDYIKILDRATSFRELCQLMYGHTPGGRPGTPGSLTSGGRYFAVNLFPYAVQGTIEFRQLQGTVEDDTIIYWIYWLHFLWEVSKRKRLSYFNLKQLKNITPTWLATWLANRSYDMDNKNFATIY